EDESGTIEARREGLGGVGKVSPRSTEYDLNRVPADETGRLRDHRCEPPGRSRREVLVETKLQGLPKAMGPWTTPAHLHVGIGSPECEPVLKDRPEHGGVERRTNPIVVARLQRVEHRVHR